MAQDRDALLREAQERLEETQTEIEGLRKSKVYFYTRNVTTEAVIWRQILPTPFIQTISREFALQEGGDLEEGDIFLRSLARSRYTRESLKTDSEDGNLEKFWVINNVAYTTVNIKDGIISYDVQIRKYSSAGQLVPPNEIAEVSTDSPGFEIPESYPASKVSIESEGFDGNLEPADNTVQKLAEKVDDLTAAGDGNGGVGPAGPEGPQGPQGPVGNDGARGPQGPKGDRGEKGDPGDDGTDGADGQRGQKGDTGARGPAGPAGADGNDGQRGPVGPQGPQGNPGAAGRDGTDGRDGQDGAIGPRGPEGPQGPIGPQGPQGEPGSGGGGSQTLTGHLFEAEMSLAATVIGEGNEQIITLGAKSGVTETGVTIASNQLTFVAAGLYNIHADIGLRQKNVTTTEQNARAIIKALVKLIRGSASAAEIPESDVTTYIRSYDGASVAGTVNSNWGYAIIHISFSYLFQANDKISFYLNPIVQQQPTYTLQIEANSLVEATWNSLS